MANLIFAQYIVDAIIYDVGTPVAYHYVGTTASAPNADVADITDQNIPAITFTYADPQGKTVYSKCEHAVSFYLDANIAEVALTGGAAAATLYTAPSAGVVRVWTTVNTCTIYINGTVVWADAQDGVFVNSKAVSRPLNLTSGDVVSIKTTGNSTAHAGFLPDTY